MAAANPHAAEGLPRRAFSAADISRKRLTGNGPGGFVPLGDAAGENGSRPGIEAQPS